MKLYKFQFILNAIETVLALQLGAICVPIAFCGNLCDMHLQDPGTISQYAAATDCKIKPIQIKFQHPRIRLKVG